MTEKQFSRIEYITDHDLHVMLLDSYAGNVLVGEKRWTVDEDLCEF